MGPAQPPGGGDVLILSTLGGGCADDGSALQLGMHTGHWELGLLVREAALELKRSGSAPSSVYGSDPCDGRTQGTSGMLDSLACRNTAAEAFGRLVRPLPTRRAERRRRRRYGRPLHPPIPRETSGAASGLIP